MNERDYTRKLAALFNSVPGCVCRTLPDTGARGHKKPYDMFVIYKGRHISVEAKMVGGKLEPHQINALMEDEKAGAACFVARYVFCGFHFHLFINGEEDWGGSGYFTWDTPVKGLQQFLDWAVSR